MSDDIVTRLREHADEEKKAGAYVLRDALSEAADEIERLERSIQFSAAIISTYTNQHPEEVLNYLKEEGRRNG